MKEDMETLGEDENANEKKTQADELSDRESVEWVFGLLGGELMDEPWKPSDADGREWTVTYWFDGVPEYAESEYDWTGNTYRTAIRDEMFGPMPDVLVDSLGTYNRVGSFRSSGEAELPDQSYAYIGDGWSEIVYQLEEGQGTA